jgi:hypothetical protein
VNEGFSDWHNVGAVTAAVQVVFTVISVNPKHAELLQVMQMSAEDSAVTRRSD